MDRRNLSRLESSHSSSHWIWVSSRIVTKNASQLHPLGRAHEEVCEAARNTMSFSIDRMESRWTSINARNFTSETAHFVSTGFHARLPTTAARLRRGAIRVPRRGGQGATGAAWLESDRVSAPIDALVGPADPNLKSSSGRTTNAMDDNLHYYEGVGQAENQHRTAFVTSL
ncbi:uncharacterized protein BO97DRAFT_411973 [Aspergillus homomorphus CBS 101889]|uniref:Uncharacterized protein n=1 Tax=Aspergillus homomorphus (strain CBS 101889) TaxID=1450537 RepID=A0A395I637_ASPHC|nr:hypothetical protein BO97DRAFT_411973 [Aspergillus homomorphus CBS 101889]RAL15219.1 hypothetical protein BO97DRAFT_411973 [Aspergillus homomorphus CBS 101889]